MMNRNRPREKRYTRCSVFILISFSFGFFLIVLVVGNVFSSRRGGKGTKIDYQSYKFTQLNPFKNKSSIGIVSIPRMNEEYVSEVYQNGNYILISKIGSTDYECKGSCWCERKNKPTTQNLYTWYERIIPVRILLSSTSSGALLLKKAGESIESECDNLLSGDCSGHEESIVYDVDGCKKISNEFEDSSPRDLRKYACDGHCVNSRSRELKELVMHCLFDVQDWIGKTIKFSADSELITRAECEGKSLYIGMTEDCTDLMGRSYGKECKARALVRFRKELGLFCRSFNGVPNTKVCVGSRVGTKCVGIIEGFIGTE